MNIIERAEVIKAMETIARCVNDEVTFEQWLINGIADGTDLRDPDEIAYYAEDENFADLMTEFLYLMIEAGDNGGLYCDGITSKEDE